MRYFNHYFNPQDDLIAVDPWDGLLDLQKERGNLTSFNNSALEIITEIQITYTNSAFRRSGMTAIPRKMLDNPEYRMEIRKRFISVVSRQVIDALTHMVTYYPGVSLIGDQVKIEELLVSTYVKEKDNNRIKGGKTGVIFWSKVYCLSIRDINEAHILYINGR